MLVSTELTPEPFRFIAITMLIIFVLIVSVRLRTVYNLNFFPCDIAAFFALSDRHVHYLAFALKFQV
jgi:hypothetical protein